MSKTLTIAFLVAFSSLKVNAQTPDRESATRMAKADAKKFTLSDADFKQFKKHRHKSSDYFKPSKAYASDTTLLRDSDYVHTFRRLAYRRTPGRRSAGHSLLIGLGSTFVAFSLLVIVAYNIFLPGKVE